MLATFTPGVVSVRLPPTGAKLIPPLVEIYSPSRSPPVFASELKRPIPAYTTFALLRSKLRAPIDREEMKSVEGFQVGLALVALVVLHTPPLTAPMSRILALVGCTASTFTAP